MDLTGMVRCRVHVVRGYLSL